jgi:hypothetical protein
MNFKGFGRNGVYLRSYPSISWGDNKIAWVLGHSAADVTYYLIKLRGGHEFWEVRTWNEMVVAYFKTLSQNLSGDTEWSHKTSLRIRTDFLPGISVGLYHSEETDGKGMVKLSLCLASRILDLGTRWSSVVSSTLRRFYPRGKNDLYALDWRLLGP